METPEEKFTRIMKLTPKDVHAAAKEIFKFNHAKMGVIGPFKSADEFLKIADLPWL